MSRFITFNLDAIRHVLKPSNGWTEAIIPGTCEYVYYQDIRGLPLFKTKVLSTVSIYNGWSRALGEDSIKVNTVFYDASGKEHGLTKPVHVHRTKNWRENLFKAVTRNRLNSIGYVDYLAKKGTPRPAYTPPAYTSGAGAVVASVHLLPASSPTPLLLGSA